MIELAGEIIAAQVGEIDEMTTWLVENAKSCGSGLMGQTVEPEPRHL